MSGALKIGTVALGALGVTAAGFVGAVTGRVTTDFGVGRRVRPLGPIEMRIAAPREMVYAALTAPYAVRRPRAMAAKVEILERGADMVLAAHHTPAGLGLVATTVETVGFEEPARVTFRLVRGPVPLVTEAFDLTEVEGATLLTYSGELGTDLGAVGEWWGDLVAKSWIASVTASMETTKTESERRNRHAR